MTSWWSIFSTCLLMRVNCIVGRRRNCSKCGELSLVSMRCGKMSVWRVWNLKHEKHLDLALIKCSARAHCFAPPRLSSSQRVAKDRPVERGWGEGSFPGRKLAGCFNRSDIAIGPRENVFPGPAVALDGPGCWSYTTKQIKYASSCYIQICWPSVEMSTLMTTYLNIALAGMHYLYNGERVSIWLVFHISYVKCVIIGYHTYTGRLLAVWCSGLWWTDSTMVSWSLWWSF